MCFINQESIIGEAINLNMMYLSTCNVMQLTGWAKMLITGLVKHMAEHFGSWEMMFIMAPLGVAGRKVAW